MSGGQDKTVRLWDLVNGRERLQARGHTARVLTVAYAPDGKTVYSGGQDGTLRQWDAITARRCASTTTWQHRPRLDGGAHP